MAVGDKLVTLDGLKAVYQDVNGNIVELRSEIGSTELELWDNKLINTALETKILPANTSGNTGYKCIVVPCVPGDIFQVSGKGGTNPRLWAFADSEGTMISQDDISTTRTNYQIIAPKNAAYFAYNCRKEYEGTPAVYKNGTPDIRLKTVEDSLDNLYHIIYHEHIEKTGFQKPTLTRGVYYNESGVVQSATKYAGTQLFVPDKNMVISVENDQYEFRVFRYDSDGTSDGTGFIMCTEWNTSGHMIIPNDWEKIAVVVKRRDFKVIVAGSETAIINNVTKYYSMTDTGLTVPNFPADAKAAGDRITATEQMLDALFSSYLNVVSINHRGYHVDAPENTIPAFIQSRKMGFDAVETDVRFTQDGVPVLLHNDTLDGICCLASDGSAITGNLAINSIDSSNLSAYDACTPAKWATYKGTKIPTLREFLVLCRKIGLHPYLEIKTGATAELVAICINVVKDCGMLDHVVWFSSDKTVLGHVHTALPEATLAIYESETILDGDITDALALKTAGNEVIMWVHTSTSETLSANITKCKNAGLTLYLGTNEIDDILTIDPYISGVNSDTLHAGKILFDSVMNAE